MKRNKDAAEGSGRGIEALEPRTLMAFAGLPFPIGGSGVDFGQRVVATSDGGFVVAGLFSGTVDFDRSTGTEVRTSQSDTDIFVAKYDSAGALVWVQQLGGSAKHGRIRDQERIIDIAADPRRVSEVFIHGIGQDPKNAGEYINDIAVAADGSIVIVGEFIGQMTVPVLTGAQSFRTFDDEFYDAFVMRLNSNGQIQWARQFGDRFTDTASAVALDTLGNIVVTGVFTRRVNFSPGSTSFIRNALGRADGYAMKLNASGAVQWVNQFGGGATDSPVRDAGNDITTDSAGNVYVVGQFGGSADFDPSLGVFRLRARDLTDGMLVKYSPTGRFRSALAFSGNRFDALTHVAVDSNLDIIVAGYFQGERFDADPTARQRFLSATPKEPGDEPERLDGFVEKLARGRVAWVQQVRGDRSEFINDLELDSDNNVILTGAWYGTATFGASPTLDSVRGPDEFRDRNDSDRGESYDAFLWKLTPGGGTIFANRIGAEEDDFGVGVALGSDDSILLIGRFDSTVDFDPGVGQRRATALGLADAFIAAFDALGSLQV